MIVPLLLAFSIAIPADGPTTVRFATFNASLNRDEPGALIRDLSTPDNVQAANVAEIIQRVAPDVLLINEFDYDKDGEAMALFQKNYLAIGRNGAKAIQYPYRHAAEVNTGVHSGFDLDNSGEVVAKTGSRGYGNDAFGFGQFPGQYGMAVYSKYPIDTKTIQSFHLFKWKDMPGALLPTREDGTPWYPAGALNVFRLSSKAHWVLPLNIGGKTVHLLASHPTPPAFDGPEDRNGKRNHDEIRLWADYLHGGTKAAYLRADGAADRPITPPAAFVLMGDQNADPHDGGSVPDAIQQLLNHPRIDVGFIPKSDGAAEASRLQGQANKDQKGPPEVDTADFDDRSVGNLRVDYVLPSKGLKVVGGAVFWPKSDDPLARLVRMRPEVASSDHRLVYLDIIVPAPE